MRMTTTESLPLDRKVALFVRLRNTRRMQAGARAAATTRKLETLRVEILAHDGGQAALDEAVRS